MVSRKGVAVKKLERELNKRGIRKENLNPLKCKHNNFVEFHKRPRQTPSSNDKLKF